MFHNYDRAILRNAYINFNKKIFVISFLLSFVIFFHYKKFFLFTEVLFTTFNQFLLNFFYLFIAVKTLLNIINALNINMFFLKFNIKCISDNLQLIINEKFNWFRCFNNNLNKLTRFSLIRNDFHSIFFIYNYLYRFYERFFELFD